MRKVSVSLVIWLAAMTSGCLYSQVYGIDPVTKEVLGWRPNLRVEFEDPEDSLTVGTDVEPLGSELLVFRYLPGNTKEVLLDNLREEFDSFSLAVPFGNVFTLLESPHEDWTIDAVGNPKSYPGPNLSPHNWIKEDKEVLLDNLRADFEMVKSLDVVGHNWIKDDMLTDCPSCPAFDLSEGLESSLGNPPPDPVIPRMYRMDERVHKKLTDTTSEAGTLYVNNLGDLTLEMKEYP